MIVGTHGDLATVHFIFHTVIEHVADDVEVQTADGTGEPGTVLCADARNGLIIACGTGAVRILEIQAPGGKTMKSEDYLRGHSLPAGLNLKEVDA